MKLAFGGARQLTRDQAVILTSGAEQRSVAAVTALVSATTGLACILMTDLVREIGTPNYQFKLVFNDRGVIVIPGTTQHNTARAPGIWYEHDHRGNALAAMVYRDTIEVRGHADFTPERVRGILMRLSRLSPIGLMLGMPITYRGKPIGKFGGES